MIDNLESLKYPVGKFTSPTQIGEVNLAEAIAYLKKFPQLLSDAVANLDDEQFNTPYREGGWTVKQLVHHIADSHMNAYIRFKLALTEESPVIKPYQEASWAELKDSQITEVKVSLQLLGLLHQRWTNLIESMSDEDFKRTYMHPQYQTITPLWNALALYYWHSRHHLAHITSLKNRLKWN